MSTYFTILALVLLIVSCESTIPNGYILKVTPSCGSSTTSDAYVTVTTDLHAQAKAVCQSGEVSFNENDGVNLHLDVSYPSSVKFPCVFQKMVNSSVYTLLVKVSFGEEGNPIQQHEMFRVTCTFDNKKTEESAMKNITGSLIAPNEVQSHMGFAATSAVTLTLCDVLGNQFTDSSVAIGRKVQLMVEMDGSGAEIGIRPVHCDAVGVPNGKRYALLRAGARVLGKGDAEKLEPLLQVGITLFRHKVRPYCCS
ncbi:vitelline envelope sperm lysin receptor-like isoform X2 [Gigantopelta aegis]|uniref:vitelline envelope sperm lysin receptor-like isoform X2 n=1 Tax=Gigantopelta aegis TaxID=1735272 RepID=UPI001B88B875|nr:vitelline envelope sperm lysin receptor-like isoform X2 [Gigantopelta aegis]